MKTRVIKNWVTTVLGIIFLGAALYRWTQGAAWQECSAVAGIGLVFVRAKNSLIPGLKPIDK